MYYLVYVSNTQKPFEEEELINLLHECTTNNKEHAITGLLIYSESKFIQVLEGEKDVVHALFKRIKTDARHHKATIIIEGNLEFRNYPDWTMAFRSISAADLDKKLGFASISDYFEQHQITESSHVAEVFMKLFFDKNYKHSIV